MDTKLLCTLLLLTIHFTSTLGQEAWEGAWQGALEAPGITLEMEIDLRQENQQWSGHLNIPVQNISEMALSELTISDYQLAFTLPQVPGDASYAGTLAEDGSVITGSFTQGGQAMKLDFRRLDVERDNEINLKLTSMAPFIDSLMEKHHVPGMAIAVVRDGELIVNQGFGYADVAAERPVTSNTLFAIGSTTKAITASGLAVLVEQEKIAWEKPIVEYLPDFQMFDAFASQEMTALDLTTHRSGLPRHDLLWYITDFDRYALYNRLKHLEPTHSFRSTWQYQNLMYLTAGILIEQVSGHSWEDFTQQEILTPLGMNRTNFSIDKMKSDGDAALGYRVSETDEFEQMEYRNIDPIGPAGSINSCSDDMALWLKFQLANGKVQDQQIISESQFQLMHAPHMIVSTTSRQPEFTHPSYGTGWFIYHYEGNKIVQHGGNIDGFSAYVHLLPDENAGMVFLTNKNGAALPSVIAHCMTDIILEKEDPIDWTARIYGQEAEEKSEEAENNEDENLGRVAGTSPSHALTDYSGMYEHVAYPEIEITLKDEILYAMIGDLTLPLEHVHYDIFEGEDQILEISLKLNFLTDELGFIQSLTVPLEPSLDPLKYEKKADDQRTDAAFIKRISGNYIAEGFLINIYSEKNRLFIAPQGQPIYELLPFHKNHFKAKGLPGYSIEFIFDGAEVSHSLMHQPNGVFKMPKE